MQAQPYLVQAQPWRCWAHTLVPSTFGRDDEGMGPTPSKAALEAPQGEQPRQLDATAKPAAALAAAGAAALAAPSSAALACAGLVGQT